MNFNLTAMTQTVITLLTTVGLKLLGAIAIWIIGRWLINFALRLIGGALTKHKLDPTLKLRGTSGSGGRCHWHGVVRAASELCRRRVSRDPPAIQG
jgi:hypothetical protein